MSKPASYVVAVLALLLLPFAAFFVTTGENPAEIVSFRRVQGAKELLVSLVVLAAGISCIYFGIYRLWNPDSLNPPWHTRRLLNLAVAFPILMFGWINGSSVERRGERRLTASLSLGMGLVLAAMAFFAID